jgi:hypothetical protein
LQTLAPAFVIDVIDVIDGATSEQMVVAPEAQIAALSEERDEYRKLALHLREEVERLKRGLIGQKAERLPKNDAQLSLLMLGLALGGDVDPPALPLPAVEQTVAEHTRAKPVRKPLPPNLPRIGDWVLARPSLGRAPSHGTGPVLGRCRIWRHCGGRFCLDCLSR